MSHCASSTHMEQPHNSPRDTLGSCFEVPYQANSKRFLFEGKKSPVINKHFLIFSIHCKENTKMVNVFVCLTLQPELQSAHHLLSLRLNSQLCSDRETYSRKACKTINHCKLFNYQGVHIVEIKTRGFKLISGISPGLSETHVTSVTACFNCSYQANSTEVLCPKQRDSQEAFIFRP